MIHKRPHQILKRFTFRWLFRSIMLIFIFPVQNSYGEVPLNVYVVNYPLKYFAERIGANHVKVEFPAPPAIDPAYWNPDLAVISAYQKADLILLNGAGYAKWVGTVSLPRSKMVDTSRQFRDQYITSKQVLTHSHGAEGKHAHESLAFTTWIDFSLAAEQSKAIAQALSRKRPGLEAIFQRNYQELEKDLLKLDGELKALASRDPSIPFVVSHPVYDYLARRYMLNIKSVHWEPNEMPTDEQMLELRAILKDHMAKWMIWEGEPIKDLVEELKAIGMKSVVFDPCSNVPDEGDFLSVMQQNINNLKPAFQ